MTTKDAVERRAILLGRLSDNREEDEELSEDGIPLALEDQVERMTERAQELGWTVWKVIQNPRLSAYKKRKITLPDGTRDYRVFRPDLREALGHLAAGRANAMVCLDLDRAFRDPADLRDLINVVEHSPHSIIVESVTGSLHMEKGYDNFDAEIRVLVANKASRDTARRVASARKKRVLAGKFGGGPRPYGFESDGLTIRESEAAVIAECSRRVLEIDGQTENLTSLRSLARELNERGLTTARGKKWTNTTLRTTLLRPRNAGLLVYCDKEVGAAPWAPIVPEDVYRAVHRLVNDPARSTPKGALPKNLGSGIYRCGVCNDGTKCQLGCGKKHERRYVCDRLAHLARNAAYLDKFMEFVVVGRICEDGIVESFVHRASAMPEVDVAALRAEATAIRVKLNALAEDYVLEKIDRAQMLTGTQLGKDRLVEVKNELASASVDSPLRAFVDVAPENVLATWRDQPKVTQRSILDTLTQTTLKRQGKGGHGFNSDAVDVRWKTPSGDLVP
jgi:DNA invertase Pin-like site-specific DNA recombinase